MRLVMTFDSCWGKKQRVWLTHWPHSCKMSSMSSSEPRPCSSRSRCSVMIRQPLARDALPARSLGRESGKHQSDPDYAMAGIIDHKPAPNPAPRRHISWNRNQGPYQTFGHDDGVGDPGKNGLERMTTRRPTADII